jgi:hypothetical protein
MTSRRFAGIISKPLLAWKLSVTKPLLCSMSYANSSANRGVVVVSGAIQCGCSL